LADLRRANVLLAAVMDRLDTGAIAIDAEGVIQAANQPARSYLHLDSDPRGTPLLELLGGMGLGDLGETVGRLITDSGGSFEDIELNLSGGSRSLRLSAQTLSEGDSGALGRVILFKEISHEPLRRAFDEIVATVSGNEGEVRSPLEEALGRMRDLAEEVGASGISSPGMAELLERVSRGQTAMQSWLDVDDELAREDYPDAQLLIDRMRLAGQRWPRTHELPPRVTELLARVDSYYESGENSKQRVL
jgi:hypothetical protein